MAEGNDPNGQQAQQGAQGNDPNAAGGQPSDEQKAKRLEQEVASLKKQLEEANGQVTSLTENLGKALTEEDVKAAVEAAKKEAEEAQQKASAAATEREKRLIVENELIKASCIDTAGAMAHIDMAGVEVAKDGHVSGLDVAKLSEEFKHLFQQPNAGTVNSAGMPGGNGKKMTKKEVMAIKDPAERRAAIAANMAEFEPKQ